MTFKPLPGLVIFGDLLTEIMQHPWPPQSKKGFSDLLARGKSPKVSVLEAESSGRRHDSRIFAERVIFPKI